RAGFRAPRTRAAAGCGQWAVSAPAARPSTVSGATITALTVHSGSVQPIDSGAMTSGRPEASTGRACATASPAWARRPAPSHAGSRGRSPTRPAPPSGPPRQALRRGPSRPQSPWPSPPSGGRTPTIATASAPSSALIRRAAVRAPSSVSPPRSGSDARAAASRAANAAFSAGPAGARRARRSRCLPRAPAATAAVTARTRRHATAPATDGRIMTTYGNGCRRRRSPGCPFTGAGTPDPPRAARPARRAHASQRRGLALFLLVGVALLPPRVGDVVVAALLPEAAAVLHHVLHAAHPLDALPRVQVRDHDAQGEAVVGGEPLPVAVGGEHRRLGEEIAHPDVGAIAVLRPDHHVRDVRGGRGELRDDGAGH